MQLKLSVLIILITLIILFLGILLIKQNWVFGQTQISTPSCKLYALPTSGKAPLKVNFYLITRGSVFKSWDGPCPLKRLKLSRRVYFCSYTYKEPGIYGPYTVYLKNKKGGTCSLPLITVVPPSPPNPTQPLSTSSLSYNYDVLVVGGSEAGIAAAIQAARLGAKVAVLESTDWIGGQMTAQGVGAFDLVWDTGILRELIDKIRAYYSSRGWSTKTCYFSSICSEPHVTKSKLYELINEVRQSGRTLDIYLRRDIIGVLRTGNTVTGVKALDKNTTREEIFNARVTIEASGYGDVLRFLPGSYKIGANDNGGCVQDVTYVATIRRYQPGTMPPGLRMSGPVPEISELPYYGHGGAREKFIQHVTNPPCIDKNNNPKDCRQWPAPIDFPFHNGYRGLPDPDNNPNPYVIPPQDDSNTYDSITKTGVNYANDFPHDANAFLDLNSRREQACRAKFHTLQFLWYVQNELGFQDWSVANDEGYNTAYNTYENVCSIIPNEYREIERHMSVMPYLREGMRLVGITTVEGKQVPILQLLNGELPPDFQFYQGKLLTFDDAIAFAQEMDLHNCPGFYAHTTRFQIPFRALISKNYDGLVGAGLNISVDRYVNGGTRLHGTSMMTGQAAGAIAALAVKHNVQPRMLNPHLVQEVLLDANPPARLFPFDETELPLNDPYFKPIQLVALRGIMIGYGHPSYLFGRNDPVPRATMAVIINKMLEYANKVPEVDECNPNNLTFADVPCTHPQWREIERIFRAGITTGCRIEQGLRYFCPDHNITRGQMAILLYRTWKYLNPSLIDYYPDTSTFEDVKPGNIEYTAVETFVGHGIPVDKYMSCATNPRKFCPTQDATRAFLTPFIVRILELGTLSPEVGTSPTTSTSTITPPSLPPSRSFCSLSAFPTSGKAPLNVSFLLTIENDDFKSWDGPCFLKPIKQIDQPSLPERRGYSCSYTYEKPGNYGAYTAYLKKGSACSSSQIIVK